MRIQLSPISMFTAVEYAVEGDSIIINGTPHALTDLAVAETLPDFVVAAAEDSVTLLLPYWGEASEAVRFPESIIDPPDGPLELPQ